MIGKTLIVGRGCESAPHQVDSSISSQAEVQYTGHAQSRSAAMADLKVLVSPACWETLANGCHTFRTFRLL